MKITVEFPLIMKMQLTTDLEVEDNATLSEVKYKIFSVCWEPFLQRYSFPGMSGSIHDIVLESNNIEITTNDDFREYKIFRAHFRNPNPTLVMDLLV